MIGTAIVLQSLELVGWGGLWWKLKASATKQILIHGRIQPQRIPIVDSQLKQMAGHPTKFQRMVGERTVKFIRRAVNTRAFEHLMFGIINPQSKLRGLVKKPHFVRIP